MACSFPPGSLFAIGSIDFLSPSNISPEMYNLHQWTLSDLPKLALKTLIHSLSCSRMEFSCSRSIVPPQLINLTYINIRKALNEVVLKALEKANEEKEAHGEIETEHPGYLLSQDTYYVGTIKGVGRIYQQTVIDTYSKVAFVKLYDRKNALVAADMLNDQVIPWFEEQDIRVLRILTDRVTEYCGAREHHEYELYLAIEDIDHSRTKARHPQTNGICERFHQTIQNEFYATAFRKKVFKNVEELQEDVDKWMNEYNNERTHTGKYCFGKTPLQTFLDANHLAQEKMLDKLQLTEIVPAR
ncbi:Integrase core domain protein [Neochlamydia sp. EPS4]|nr:Integrase core domain protein [Neochlamydia sp. EPS4]